MVFENTKLIVGVIAILTSLLLVIGIQVFTVLRDLKNTLQKAEQVLSQMQEILEIIHGPILQASHTLSGLQTIGKVAGFFLGTKKGRKVAKEVSSHGRQAFGKIHEVIEEFENEEIEEHKEIKDVLDGHKGNGEKVPLSSMESLSPQSFLTAGRRFFKGIPKISRKR